MGAGGGRQPGGDRACGVQAPAQERGQRRRVVHRARRDGALGAARVGVAARGEPGVGEEQQGRVHQKRK
ncbi:hypothetical protein [Nonomuraea salmonea]|uniref:hypothetical protein n=1 Tax=Nonomuraea salmonea TaxID=46181 RepID=UPI0031E8A838